MADPHPTYHIVGGGIAGLACAFAVKQKCKHARAVIYEAGSQLGGRAFSYKDEKFNCLLDNAVHAIVGANKFMARFIHKEEWLQKPYFLDVASKELSTNCFAHLPLLIKSFCNTSADEVDKKIKKHILFAGFPYHKNRRKVWFSKQNLSQRIINLLSGYADEVHLNCRLKNIAKQFGLAAQLEFEKKQVDIGANDKVIIALDNPNCSKLLNVPLLEHNRIVNIVFLTSQTIFLPKGASVIGVENGVSDWLFSNDGLLFAVISDYQADAKDLNNLAVKVWEELDEIRGVNSAFMPPYKAFCFNHATIRQNAENNKKRPVNASTEYPNVFIAGDWTMQNHPCCMETAVKSAYRAVRNAMKSA